MHAAARRAARGRRPARRHRHRADGARPGPAGRGRSRTADRPPRGLDAAGGLAALRGLLDRPLASYYLLLSSAGLLLLIGLTMVFSATSVQDYAEDGNASPR